MVAIIGNDAVLAAAPATPVQIAHACLRRGFTVAVPASWGDELVAAEAVRRLASRERGPAVMCVCPFVRSRLLAPGPDLAPFLVSLVSPPVATARYLRAAYGDHGVHITYIGGCPSADDPSVDARLTPDAFFADLAEQGIALSEQPLVFDSIVPPDRRRWCSLPGGAPTEEFLGGDGDTRSLVEIDRDDVSTDLAQHIITHEHVLLDLAPGLGCACSGALGSLPPRSARSAVTALEPPRASKPVIDPAPMVSLDIPVAEQVTSALLVAASPTASATDVSMERRLDELLGSPTDRPWTDGDVQTEAHVNVMVESVILGDVGDASASMLDREVPITALVPDAPTANAPTHDASAEVIDESATMAATRAETEVVAPAPAPPTESATEPTTPTIAARFHVRRRTPAPMPARYPTSTIPRATASDGKALPRAYVAKRRTPSTGILPTDEARRSAGGDTPGPEGPVGSEPSTPPSSSVSADAVTEPAAEPSPASDPVTLTESTSPDTGESKASATTDSSETNPPPTAASEAPLSDRPDATSGTDQPRRPESNTGNDADADGDASPSVIVTLVLVVLALGSSYSARSSDT